MKSRNLPGTCTPSAFHPFNHLPLTFPLISPLFPPPLSLLFFPANHRVSPDPVMKLNLTSIFRSKSRSMSKSEPLSFSSSSSDPKDTPKSVLPSHIPFRSPKIDEISGEFSDHSSEINWNSVEVFNLFDKDGDGKISRDELEQVLCRLGCQPLTEEELVMMMEEADHDGDGCISFEEFSALSLASGPACGTDLRDAFTVFDRDGDGRISAEELLEVFEALGDDGCTLDECRRMIGGVDTDGDGFVCFDDFARMMLEQR